MTHKAKNSITGDQLTIYDYDDLGRVVTTTWPDTGETLQTYDAQGNRISTTDPNGTVVVCAYDDNNRLTSKDMTLATNVVGIDSIDYGYDGLNRMTSADAAEGTSFTSVLEWTYNTLGKQETEKQIIDGYNSGNGRTLTYDWNVKGQKTGVTYPVSGDVITYDQDELDRVDKVSRGSAEVVDYTFSGPRILQKEYPGSKAIHAYDGYGRLTQIEHEDSSSGNTLAQFDYGYDDSHQIIWMDKLYYDDVENTRILDDVTDEGDQYSYDGAKRLVTVLRGVATADIATSLPTNLTAGDYTDKVEYHYDQTGNRLTREIDDSNDVVYAYNKVNEMTTEDGNTLSYDANGNFTGSSNSHKYGWNNQLDEYDDGSSTVTWHRDALGRSIQRDDSSRSVSPRNYYDGMQRIEAVTWTGSVEVHRKTLVWGERPDELLLMVNIAPNPDEEYYAHADHLGSVQVMVEDDGSIAESYRYREFGEPSVLDDAFDKTSPIDSGIGNPAWYTGQLYADKLSGAGDAWYDYKARHYRSDAGRFVQRDPVFSSNSYWYVAARPLQFVDPLGRQSYLNNGNGQLEVDPDVEVEDEGEPCEEKVDIDGDGKGITCDCSTGGCSKSDCQVLMASVFVAIMQGKISENSVEGVSVECDASINCSQHKKGEIKLNPSNLTGDPGCKSADMTEALFHELGHALGASWRAYGIYNAERMAWNFACHTTQCDQATCEIVTLSYPGWTDVDDFWPPNAPKPEGWSNSCPDG